MLENNDDRLSDPTSPVRRVQVTQIDRTDDRGDIREHLTRDGRRTICGLKIDASGRWEAPGGARVCKRCEKIAERCQIAPPAASWEQNR